MSNWWPMQMRRRLSSSRAERERTRRKKTHRLTLGLEQLEERATPSVTVTSTATAITILIPATETATLNTSLGFYTITDPAGINVASSGGATVANTYTVTAGAAAQVTFTIAAGSGGIVKLGAAVIPTTTTVTINAGTLDLGGFSDAINALNGGGIVTDTGAAATLTVGSSGGTGTFSGIIQNGTGTLTLIKNGAGTQTLSGANTYGGNTTVSLGTLRLGASNVIPDGTSMGDVSVTGTLDLGGFNETINGLAGGGTVDNSTGVSTYTLTVGNNNATGSFSGIVKNTSGTVSLIKRGSGTQTLSGANTYSGLTTINNGKLVAASNTALGSNASGTVVSGGAIASGLVHRYSFNEAGGSGTTLADSVGTANGTIVEAGPNDGTVGGGQVTLSGGSRSQTDYASFPSGLVSGLTDATFEFWATPITYQSSSQIFDFGSGTSNYVMMSWTQNINLNTDRVEVAGPGAFISDNTNQPWTLTTEHHIVMTIKPGGGTGGQTLVSWYKNGTLSGSVSTTWTLSQLVDTNVWLGRSQVTTDRTANASYNEFRIYNVALTAAQVSADFTAGPNASSNQLVLDSSLAGDLTVTGEALTLNGTGPASGGALVNTLGNNTWTGPVTLATDSLVTVGAGQLTVGGTVNGARNLTVTAGANNILFNGLVGNTTALTSILVNSAATLTFGSTVATSGNVTQSAGTGTTTFNGTSGNGIGGNLAVTTNAVALNTAVMNVAGTVNTNAQNAVTANANLNAVGAIVLASSLNDITLGSAVNSTGSNVTLNAGGNINTQSGSALQAFGGIALNFGTVNDGSATATISGTLTAASASATGTAGNNDTLTVNYQTAVLTITAGAGLVFNGGAGGTDSLIGSGSISGDTFTITSTTLTKNGNSPVTYGNLEAQTVNAGDGDDTINLTSGSNMTANGQNDNDHFFVNGAVTAALNGNDGNDDFNLIAALTGSVSGGAGSDSVSYAGYGGAISVTLTGPATADGYRGFATALSGGFDTIDSVTGTSGSDTLKGEHVASTWTLGTASTYRDAATNALSFAGFETLSGGVAADAFVVKNNAMFAGVSVNGGTGINSISFADATNTSGVVVGVSGTNAGSVSGSFNFVGIAALTGTSANDNLTFTTNGAKLTGVLAGGGGTDALSYSGYTGSVRVNLPAGSATGTAGVFNIQNVTGGSGNDILLGSNAANIFSGGVGNDVLVGGGGSDILNGDSGQDILIGGAGADVLDGGAGDDILIGGITTYDANISALNAIMAEWARTSVAYATRVGRIFGSATGGLNGSYRYNNSTISDDAGAADVLTGGDGMDWFLASTGDTISDLNSGGIETQKIVS